MWEKILSQTVYSYADQVLKSIGYFLTKGQCNPMILPLEATILDRKTFKLVETTISANFEKSLVQLNNLCFLKYKMNNLKVRTLENYIEKFKENVALTFLYDKLHNLVYKLYSLPIKENSLELFSDLFNGSMHYLVTNLNFELVNDCILLIFRNFIDLFLTILVNGGKERICSIRR